MAPDSTAKRLAAEEAIVRVGPLSGLPALVRELGRDPDPVFVSAGFNVAQFSNPDDELSYLRASGLLARCVEATGCDHLGLLLGERTDPSLLGIVGFMLKVAPDVGTAIQDVVRHLELHDRGAIAILDTHGDATHFGYAIHLAGVEAADQIYDLSIAVICRIMRSLCGERWSPTEVSFSRRQPKDLLPYRRFFQAPMRFEQPQNAVIFPSRWMSHALTSSDPLLHRYLAYEADKKHATQSVNLTADLRALLLKSLMNQKQGVAEIAGLLGMHERTLNRRLREEGTTFRQALDDVRFEVARKMLSDSRMPISNIAAVFDYADATAFSRAFKRWSGVTPTEWRARHRQP